VYNRESDRIGVATVAKGYVAYHWAMSRMHPECPDSDPSGRAVTADVLHRQEPDEEDDEDEDQGDGKEDDDDKEDEDEDEDDEGYSP
jgi:hypothetical protein